MRLGLRVVLLAVMIRGIKEKKVRTVLGLHCYTLFSHFCLEASDVSQEKDKKAM